MKGDLANPLVDSAGSEPTTTHGEGDCLEEPIMDWVSGALAGLQHLLSKFPYWEFVLGLVGAYLVTWIRDARTDARLRQSAREALVREAIRNLQLLDAYTEIFTSTRDGVEQSWPTERPFVSAILHGISPGISALLTTREQTLLLGLLDSLQEFSTRLDFLQKAGLDEGSFQRRAARILASGDLSIIGVNLVALLVEVTLELEQSASSEGTNVAEKLAPTLAGKAYPLNRLWKTSDLQRVKEAPPKLLIVWKNDASDWDRSRTKVIELYQDPATPSYTLDRAIRPGSIRGFLKRHRMMQGIARHRDDRLSDN